MYAKLKKSELISLLETKDQEIQQLKNAAAQQPSNSVAKNRDAQLAARRALNLVARWASQHDTNREYRMHVYGGRPMLVCRTNAQAPWKQVRDDVARRMYVAMQGAAQ